MPLLLVPGTVLVKRWDNVEHRVTALAGSYEMGGRRFASLMDVVRQLPGAFRPHMSMREFFGVEPWMVAGAGRTRRPPGHRPPRPRRGLHAPQHPALRVEDVGTGIGDYRVAVAHADRDLVNRLARWLDRQLARWQAERDEVERLDRVIAEGGDILGDLIAESRKLGTSVTYSAEGGFREIPRN